MTAMDRWAFLFGLGAVTQVRVIGALGITELGCVALAPFLVVRNWQRLHQTYGLALLLAGLMWTASAGFTDYYRETDAPAAAKGVFAIVLLMANFVVAFSILAPDVARIRWMAVGYAVSSVISIWYFRSESLVAAARQMGESPDEIMTFKTTFAYVMHAALLAFIAVFSTRWPRLALVTAFASGFLFLVGGARNLALTTSLAATAAWLANSRPDSFLIVQRNFIAMGFGLALALAGVSGIYDYAARHEWMSEAEQTKYEYQSESDVGLLSARGEIFAALAAISDSPIIGHGSWAKDEVGYGTEMLRFIGEERKMRYRASVEASGDALIPCHSHIWQAWVWHGAFGAAFWVLVSALMLGHYRVAVHRCPSIRAYTLLLLATSGWDLLFSPFALRPRWAIVLSICVLGLAEHGRRLRASGTAGETRETWDGRWDRAHAG